MFLETLSYGHAGDSSCPAEDDWTVNSPVHAALCFLIGFDFAKFGVQIPVHWQSSADSKSSADGIQRLEAVVGLAKVIRSRTCRRFLGATSGQNRQFGSRRQAARRGTAPTRSRTRCWNTSGTPCSLNTRPGRRMRMCSTRCWRRSLLSIRHSARQSWPSKTYPTCRIPSGRVAD